MQKPLKHLSSIPFLAGLAILLVNDFILKERYHNFLTGKLSDFAGLFIFPIFWSVVFPKNKHLVFFTTAVLFVLWKSPCSESLINFFSYYFYPIYRVVDFTDLIAFASLPLAWKALQLRTLSLNFNPWLAAGLAVFSFCATSVDKPSQTFEQPQYVLFQANPWFLDTLVVDEGMRAFRQNNLIAVEVKNIRIEKVPAKDDDFHKNLILKNLSTSVLNLLYNSQSQQLREPAGTNKLSIETSEYKDIVNFSGSNLDGKFLRYSNNGELLIDGYFKDGVEDSIWTIRDSGTNLITKKTFVKGETTQIDTFQSEQLISSESLNTRKITIRNKYFHLGILLALLIATTTLIVRNSKATDPVVSFSLIYKFILAAVLSFVIVLIYVLLCWLIPDSSISLFDLALICLGAVILVMLTLSIVKIKKHIDVILYCLLLTLAFTWYMEFLNLKQLNKENEASPVYQQDF